MNTLELNNYLTKIIKYKNYDSLMIWGAPGIGKSCIVKDIANKNKLKFIDLRLGQLAPTDIRGLPVADHQKKISTWYPPEFLPLDGKGILFLDEINMAPPTLQGVAQQLILDRKVGSYNLPNEWFIWAAGNRKQDKAAVYDMPSALKNRFLHCNIESDFECFKRWAIKNFIDERIISFLGWRPELLHHIDHINSAWPSPRTWEMANNLFKNNVDIKCAVGEGASNEFYAWLKVYEKIPDLTKILNGTGGKLSFDKEPSTKYAIILGLALRSNTSEYLKNSIEWLSNKAEAEWIQMFIHALQDSGHLNENKGILAQSISKNKSLKKFISEYAKFIDS